MAQQLPQAAPSVDLQAIRLARHHPRMLWCWRLLRLELLMAQECPTPDSPALAEQEARQFWQVGL